jgi:hypothetical protein
VATRQLDTFAAETIFFWWVGVVCFLGADHLDKNNAVKKIQHHSDMYYMYYYSSYYEEYPN